MQKVLTEIVNLARSNWGTEIQKYVFEKMEPSVAQPIETINSVTSRTFLAAAAKIIKPKKFLEIGVRRGHSMCLVAKAAKDLGLKEIVGIDPWIFEYGGESNPGPELVQSEVKKFNLINVRFFNMFSDEAFSILKKENFTCDLLNIDGDHTDEGALNDLLNYSSILNSKGILMFDDITHPKHTLKPIWEKWIQKAGWTYISGDEGYGWAIAIKP